MQDLKLEQLITIAGSGLVAGVLIQVLKKNLKDIRYVNIITIVIGVGISIAAQIAIYSSYPNILTAGINGFLGAAMATLAYETTQNIRGLFNAGPRGNSQIIEWAERLLGVKCIIE